MFQPNRGPRASAFVTLALTMGLLAGGVGQVYAQGRAIYVAPNGVAGRDATIANPIDLATALSSAGPARPGDTIWVRGGAYRGAFTSTLNGTSAAPITVRQYPGERATLDNAATPTVPTLVVNGSWTIFWGLEITNSYPERFVSVSGRGTGLDIYGPNNKFINMVIHDAQNGVGFWSGAVNSELYGSIIYNNGIEWTDRGHGHSIYTQNQTGTKRIVDNIMFNGFSFGIHAYTQGGAIDNFVMDGNVSFNHGVLSAGGLKSDLLLGGGQIAHNAVITANHFYNSPGLGGRGADIGYGTPCADSRVQNNVFASDWALNLACSNTTFSGNHVYGGVNFSAGSYPSNTYYGARPTGSWVSVRANQYEAGRGHIVIYNWSRASQVAVNLAQAGLSAGDSYEIRDAQDFYGPAIASGVYGGGTANVPMTANIVAMPVGSAHVTPRHTGPDFGVFVVLRTSGSSAPAAPTAALSASPTAITTGQSATLAWSTANAATVSIDQGIGTVAASGSRTVTPTATTTYVLTATNSAGQTTTASATVTVAAAAPPPTTSAAASFVGTDTSTQGNWRGVYGAEGYTIAPSSTALPSYAQLSVNGPAYTWAASTTDPRALLLPTGTSRIAATWYSTQSFSFSLNLTDGKPHRVAVYNLDWDRQLRAQRLEIVDAATGAVLDARDAASFGNGTYFVWQMTGKVLIRVTRTSGPSPVAAALFFDATAATTPPPPAAPTVTLSATPASVTAGQSATLAWTSTNATSLSINQGIGAVAVSGSLAVTPTASTTYTITAVNSAGQTATATATVAVSASAPPPATGTGAATFVGTDSATVGNWRGVYGSDGYSLANADAALPSYAQVAFGGITYTWDPNPADARALQRATGSGRIASTWYSTNAFAINVRITDSQSHRVSLYSLDWDRQGRAQSIEVLDAATLAVLDHRDVSALAGGIYHTWTISGAVVFRITRVAGPSPVIAGVFFGAATAPSTPAPTVSLTASPASVTAGQSATLTWSSTNAASVSISPGVGAVGLSGSVTVTPTATTTYTATATNSAGQSTSASAVVSVSGSTPPPSGGTATAAFVGVDATSSGNWRGAYGSQGYALAPATFALPAAVGAAVNGQAWTWEASTTDTRALQLPSGTMRTAATWYGATSFTIDVNVTDGTSHRLAVYGLDWDRQGRTQTIEVIDAATGALLDRQESGAYGAGKYWVWRVTGKVRLRFTRTAGPSPAIAGIFVDP